VQATVYGHERKRTEVINGVGRVVRGYRGVMVCVPRWCSGLCFSVVEWFVFLSVLMVCVPRWFNGLCFSVV
jgi:hypothetical protein